ncbi:MAG: hypothetical protein A4S09_05480 [Proteobacteria bacterium SG_bin7]|nr:MAG: hypothetical protein A4S09_05480 [Proteobacteria bacterium SG_bin7]
MGIKYLSRRQFIQGVGATWLGLPLLEVMLDNHGEAYAAGGGALPRRFVVMYCGLSSGSGGPFPTDANGKLLKINDHFAPEKIGSAYDLKAALTPLSKYGVQNEVSVLSNMLLPSRNNSLSFNPGAGEVQGLFHTGIINELLYTGMRTKRGANGQAVVPSGESSDQIVAKMHAASGYAGIASLNYRIQASTYLNGGSSNISTSRVFKNGVLTTVPQEVSPKKAFDRLTTNFSSSDPATEALRASELAKRKSVLDLVKEQLGYYQKNLPSNDQRTLANWTDSIRTIEKDIVRVDQTTGGSCKKIPDPGADPAVGGTFSYSAEDGIGNVTTNNGYANEVLRGKVFNDLIQMAFACDMSRTATIMITIPQCHMNTFPITGIAGACHGLTHGEGGEGPKGQLSVAKFQAWNIDFFAQLVQKLKNTPEGSGTLIDNSALVYLPEGGLGDSIENSKPPLQYYIDKKLKVLVPHSGQNYNALVAGRAGGLNSGIHIKTNQDHPCRAVISAMKAVGVTGDKLGEVSGTVPGLI